MANFKKIFSILLVCVMGAAAVACAAPDTGDKQDGAQTQSAGNELKLVKSDYQFSPQEKMSRIKAEYLIENRGYADDDKVVAILSLDGDALIDSYLADASAKDLSVAEYAATPAGKQIKTQIDDAQTALIRILEGGKLIDSVNYRYSTVANAVAVTTTYKNFLALEALGVVKSASLAETYSRPQETEGTDASAIVNNVDVYETGIFNSGSVTYTGEGTSVAILDSGFDLSHVAFNTHKLDAGKLMFNQNAIKNFLDTFDTRAEGFTDGLALKDVYYSDKIPFKYDYADKDPDVFPFDSEHGTHVAGIIGGYADSYTDKDGSPVVDEKGESIPFKGVAIDTQLVLMKVFPDLSEGAETDDILAALEDAVDLGVDCINMSLGSACGFAREKDGDIINTVYDKINGSGVSLITAASNNYSSAFGGAQGNTSFVTNPDNGTIGSPATYAPALSVASISGIKSKYIIGNDSQVFFFNESNNIAGEENDFFKELFSDIETKGERYNFGTEQYPDRYNGLTVGADGSITLEYVTVPGYGYRANYTTVDVAGKIALVSRGDNTFEDKALQAKNAGAIACIIYNNIEGDILMSMGKSDHIPTISISKEDGVRLAQNRTGTMTFSYSQQAGPFMSDFSSWGPLPDLTLKPEITAHGGNITSSVPGGGYDQISGTSMACPNMCGIVVLIRQFIKGQPRYSHMSWKEISVLANQMLMSTATIILNEEGNPYSPRKQGAGLASLYNIVNTPAYLQVEEDGEIKDRTKIELMDDPDRKGVYVMDFNVVNTSDSAVEYELGLIGMTESVSTADSDHVAERDQILNGGFKAEVLGGDGTVNGTSVSVKAGATLKLRVTYTLSQSDKDLIDGLFPYGMYVEGFVTLKAKGEGGIDLNVPFLAFYGDWTQAPIFDKTYFEVESEAHNAGIDEEDKLKADYYATTPYGSYYINYLIPLGTYLYDIDESVYDPIPASEDRIAISDSNVGGTIDGISSVYAGLLRGCKTMTYTITDKTTGEVVYTYELENARKAFSQGGSPIPNYEFLRIYSSQLGLVNNRKYEFKMVGKLDYERDGLTTNARNAFSFDFVLDNEAPIIRSATYEKVYDRTRKKDRYYLNLTVYDNQYAMALQPLVLTGNGNDGYTPGYLAGNAIPIYGEKGVENRVRIEITDYLDNLKYSTAATNVIGFSIEDYALNQNLYLCQLPGTRGPFSFTDDGEVDGAEKSLLSIAPDEVVDLTQYLATGDDTVDADKDYLRYLTWSSSDENVAVVENGLLRGIKAGSARITVYENVFGMNASITVRVRNRASGTGTEVVLGEDDGPKAAPLAQETIPDAKEEKIKSVRFTYFNTIFAHASSGESGDIGDTGDIGFLTAHQGGLSIYPGEQIGLHYEVTPWYVKDNYASYTFKSDRPDVAEVTEEGVVTALKKGKATITLTIEGSNLMASLDITVKSEFVIDEARTLVAYKGLGGDVVIPDDEGILYIGPFCFSLYELNHNYGQELPDDDIYANRVPQYNSTIKSVKIPKGVMEIQQHAFYNCTELKSVELPDTVKFLRGYVFYGDTSLEDINLENVEAIGVHAFENCRSLKDPAFGKTYSVGEASFKGCTTITHLDLTKIRNAAREAFAGCTSLTSVTLGPLSKLSEGIFRGCGLTSVDLYESNFIPAYAFAENKDLETVNFLSETGLSSIGEYAFSGDEALQEITLPNSAFALGQNAFSGCTLLATVKLQPKTLITAAQGAIFAGSGITKFEAAGSETYTVSEDGYQLLTENGANIVFAAVNAYHDTLTIPNTVKTIADSAFAGACMKSVVFEGPVSIGAYAFANCAELTSVTFAASGTTSVGTRAFNNCAHLDTLNNATSVTSVGDYGFALTLALKDVTLADGATFNEGAFFRSGLQTVTIGKNSTFNRGAFQGCTALTTVNMPQDGGVKFGELCFSQDTALSTIDLSKAAGELGNESFFNCRSLVKADLSNITAIGDLAFANCALLADVTLGSNLKSIGMGAFMDYASNTSTSSSVTPLGPIFSAITLPASLTELGEGAFYGCASLLSVTVPDLITALPNYLFSNCTALETVVLPAGCTEIGSYAFAGCAALSEINVGNVEIFGDYALVSAGHYNNGVGEEYRLRNAELDFGSAREIGFGAFADTALGGDIQAPALTSVGAYAFQNATFTSFNAPKLASVGAAAFQGNAFLKGFTFHDTLESIGAYVFLDCTSIENFTLENGETSGVINDYAKLADGILYTTLENGGLQLSSVPAGKTIETLTVEEGTVRIENYAGNANKHIVSIVLPDSLQSIGNYAFFGYTALKSVEFRSVTAPVLENNFDDAGLEEGDPGYDILNSQFCLYTWTSLSYYHFINLAGKSEPIKMILPANESIKGYDSAVYLVCFGPVSSATRSSYVAAEQSLKDFLVYARQLKKIDKLTLSDEALVSKAVIAFNGVKQDPTQYGVTQEEWTELSSTVQTARETMLRLKIEYAKKSVRDIQARIDALPDEYDGSDALNAEILSLQEDIANLEIDDRNLLLQEKYSKLLAAYEANSGTQPGGNEGDGNGLSVGAIVGIVCGSIGGVAILAAVAVVLVFVLKKKRQ